MKKYILIEADYNDGDYVQSKHEITDEEIELIKPVAEAIEEFDKITNRFSGGYNWATKDIAEKGKAPHDLYVLTGKITEEQYDLFSDFTPSSEYGIHTIESIEILVVQEEIKLL
jgi:hypothetical protein